MLTPSPRSGPSGFVLPVIRWDGTRWLTLADPLSVGRILLVAATAGNTVVFAGGIPNFDFVECALRCVVLVLDCVLMWGVSMSASESVGRYS